MPYCHKCGHVLPDDANFCTECGTPVHSTAVSEVRLNGQAQPAPAVKSDGFAKGLILGLIVAVVCLLVSLLILGFNANKTDVVRESPEPVVEITDDSSALYDDYGELSDSDID